MNRRRFLEGILISSPIALSFIAGSGYAYYYSKRKKSYKSADEIAVIFKEQEINPEITTSPGKRTLLIIGDMHLGFGNSYYKLLENLENKIEIDKVFMEGVYEHFVQPDPYYAAMSDIAKINGHTLNKNFKEKDEQGYYKISNKFLVEGIEKKNLLYESFILNNLNQEILGYRVSKDSDSLKRIGQLYSQLKNKDFYIENISESDKELKKISDYLTIKNEKISIIKRNNHFIDVIDNKLEEYEVGVFIVGENHIKHTKRLLNHINIGEYNLLEDIASRGIGNCYIDVGQAISFNKKFN